MSHFAKVENGVVTQVIVAESDHINTLEGNWVQTSYNTIGGKHLHNGSPLRGNYAGIGYIYDEKNDVFYPPQPFASWTLDQSVWNWVAPVAMPEDSKDGKMYTWNEDSKSWIEMQIFTTTQV